MKLIKTQQLSDKFKTWINSELYPLHAKQVLEFVLDNNLPNPDKAWMAGKNIVFMTWFSRNSSEPVEFTVIIHSSGLVEIYRQWYAGQEARYTKADPTPQEFLEGLDDFRDS